MALEVNPGRAGFGEAVVLGPSQAAAQGERERNAMRNLDVQDMRTRATMQARAAQQRESQIAGYLKPEAEDVGRFQNEFNTSVLEPFRQNVSQRYQAGDRNPSNYYRDATRVMDEAQKLKNLNAKIDANLTKLQQDFGSAYDRTAVDRIATQSALDTYRTKKGNMTPEDVDIITQMAIEDYQAVNQVDAVKRFKDRVSTKQDKQTLEISPDGRTTQKIEANVSPFYELKTIRDKKGLPRRYEAIFKADRAFDDFISDPFGKMAFEKSKANVLADQGKKAEYDKALAQIAQLPTPEQVQAAKKALDFETFIDPITGTREMYAPKDLGQSSVVKYIAPKSPSKYEIEKAEAGKLVKDVDVVISEPDLGKNTGNQQAKRITLSGKLPEDVAKSLTVGNVPAYTRTKSGVLKPAKVPGNKQGIDRVYQLVNFDVIRGGGIMAKDASGRIVPLGTTLTESDWKKYMGDNVAEGKGLLTKDGFAAGMPFDLNQNQKFIGLLKAKGLTPVIMDKGRPIPINNATDLVEARRVVPEPYLSIGQGTYQEKPAGGSGNITALDVLDKVMAGPTAGERFYIPINAASVVKNQIKNFVPNIDQQIEQLKMEQAQSNIQQYLGTPGAPKPAPQATRKPKQKF